MLVEVYDDDIPAVLWWFCGTTNDDGDHDRWLASMARLDAAVGQHRRGVALLIIDDGNPPPRGAKRDAIAQTARGIRGKNPLAVVTSSTIARTIIAGLHLSGIVRFPIKGFVDVDAAVAWLAAEHAGPHAADTGAPALRAVVDEARARVELKLSAERAAVEMREKRSI